MPSVPRPKGKAKKIAYKLLGIPDNMKKQKKKRNDKIEQRLVFEETIRVR